MDWLEIQFWRIAKWIIIRGYGCDCRSYDLDDLPEMYKKPKDVFAFHRCASCRAKEVVDWIDNHISLIKEFKNF